MQWWKATESKFHLPTMFRIATRLTRQAFPKATSAAVSALSANATMQSTSVAAAFAPRFVLPAAFSLPMTSMARFFSTGAEPVSTVWIGGLPFDTEESHIRDLFEKYGEITRISMTKRRDGRFQGTAFVEYTEPAEAQAALELDGEACGSRYMKVSFALPRVVKTTERPADCSAIRFSNVPFDLTEESIRSMFEHCGDISSVHFAKDRDTGRPLGYGFVEFVDPTSCDKALDVSGADAFGRRINVEYSLRAKRMPRHKPDGCKSVYVGNLSEDVNSGMLQDLFEECGEIERIHIAVDRETGEPRGFGYVNFAHTDAVDQAIKLSGVDVQGQNIRVAFVREREERRPSFHDDRRDRHDHHRASGERGYGGRAKRGGRDEGRNDRRRNYDNNDY
ncbi:hypothetical protein H310_09430 [Aphanomyces invadans]|uniref:RRM domain-containing protein n=1 Tax=Aphanomyces invadans TaxID=157072 RepID=A0A024TV65_9STRA|nr:hypothetical protein H310_09430 [Aphanomyces invadans]ETV97511.1 hypothetical protein H310_09430 [Aphanomyces invadans]|eukprot:XP_008873720.1 hypothetical protein H310_09430 [Aphanomyces invadans]